MKILYITKLKKSIANGVTVAVIQLLNAICEEAEVAWLDLGKNNFNVNQKVRKIQRCEIFDFQPDIVVFEDPFNTVEFCIISWRLKRANIPYIISPHGCFHEKALAKHRFKKRIALKTVFYHFLKDAKAYQFLNIEEKEKSINGEKNIIIPNGIIETNNYRVRKNVKKIVFIGRKDINIKGLDILLDACKIIKNKEKNIDFTVDIYGPEHSKTDNKYINNMIKKYRLESFVANHGPIFGKEKSEVLLQSDCFIQTSRHEGFPMSILEAFTYGLPVLVTEGTNVGNLVEKNNCGWVCKCNAIQVANLIMKAVEDDIEEKSKNALILVKEFSWSKISKKTITKYKEYI